MLKFLCPETVASKTTKKHCSNYTFNILIVFFGDVVVVIAW